LINNPKSDVEDNVQNQETQKIDDNVYADILKILNPKTPKKRAKMIFVPEVLNSIEQPIIRFAAKMGVPVEKVKDMNYGKKFTFVKENHFAEINVFYGKNGFTILISPKKGHHAQLSEVAKKVIETVIYDDLVRNPDIETDNQINAYKPLNPISLN
jgi:hypothetical protein